MIRLSRRVMRLAAVLAAGLGAGAAQAGQTSVAVAANFTAAAEAIGAAFTAATGHGVVYSYGASGQLYTQITQGAPYEVFLSADEERPAKALADGLAVAGSGFTYALGKLVLWSADPGLIGESPAVLSDPAVAHVAIADPASAPYGAAAVEVMKGLGVYDALAPKLVTGKSLTQTYQFVQTGNAPVGFVALAQLAGEAGGSRWTVPEALYTPIRQDAVLLAKGAGNEAASAYLEFLKSEAGREIIARFGYGLAE